jgi:HPt (histidine-containing phosphotransfer) domain-containing protein
VLFATLARWTKSPKATIAEPAGQPAKSGDEVTVPEIEGIDVPNGLQRVAGNKRLYRDLLGQFVFRHSSAGEQIESALGRRDRNLAERLAHSVKGAAGNIGINVVFQLAGKLESAIHDSRADVQALLKEFGSELHRQAQVIQRALQAETPVQQGGEGNRAFDRVEALDAFTRLRTLLEASDADSATAYADLKELLKGTDQERRLDTLGAAINVFDFDGALLRLNEIAKDFGPDKK